MSIPVIQGNQGKLNKDLEPAYVTQGDYLDAQNVRYFTRDGQTEGSHENIIGNEFAFDLGDVDPQSKKYEVCGFSKLASSPSQTGWENFGDVINGSNSVSEEFTTQRCIDPNFVTDPATGDIYLLAGFQMWKYTVSTNKWTYIGDIELAAPLSTVRTPRLTISSTGQLACVYYKSYGSGIRITVKQYIAGSWIDKTNSATGFENSDGYTFATIPAQPTLNYTFKPGTEQIFWIGSDLYIYFIGIYNDPASLSPLYLGNMNMPRVFKYSGVGTVWNDVSSTGTWSGQVWGYLQNGISFTNSGSISYNGAPKTSGTKTYFPLLLRKDDIFLGLQQYEYYPYIAYYDSATNQWGTQMQFTSTDWNVAGGRKFESIVTTSNTYHYPDIAINSLGVIAYSMSVPSFGSNRGVFCYTNTVGSPTSWNQTLNPTILNTGTLTTISVDGGRASVEYDSSDNIFLALRDTSISGRITVCIYDPITTTWDLADFQGMNTYDCNYTMNLMRSGSDIYITYSNIDQANPGNFFSHAFASVQKYTGISSQFLQTFDFYYSNGIFKGSTGPVGSLNDFTTALYNIWDGAYYTVNALVPFSPTGKFCIQFSIEPKDLAGGTTTVGFDYYIKTSGPYTVTILQDPIPTVDSGDNKVIGSSNITNDLFILSTPNESTIISDNIYTSTSILIGPRGLSIVVPKGTDIHSGGYVVISNEYSDPYLFGTHLCEIDSTSASFDVITLVGYFPTVVNAPSCTIRNISIGFGNIGVAIKDENDGSWTYTNLLASRDLKFSTLNQADVIAERNNRGVSIYWTDNYNPLRVLYYYGDYVTNGALNNVNPLNRYLLDQVDTQLKLQQAYTGATIEYGGQGVGKLKCGNYRYSVRFTTAEGVSTAWSILSQPFSVYPIESDPYKIHGGDSETESGRSNIINISWININNYDYIEIAYVRIIPETTSAVSTLFSTEQVSIAIVKLPQATYNITYEHTGDEINVKNIIDGEIGAIPFIIKNAKNIRSLDNRLAVSNVVVGGKESDLSILFNSLTYTIEKKAIPISGTYAPSAPSQYSYLAPAQPTYQNYKSIGIGEYQDPSNVFYYTGYMLNETYRFYGVAEFYDGNLSDAYYLFDVKFNTDQASADGRRSGSITDYSINDGTLGACLTDTSNVYIPYLQINLPSVLPVIDGYPADKTVKRIHIWREDVKKRTVLANGIGVLCSYTNTPSNFFGYPGGINRLDYLYPVTDINGGLFGSRTNMTMFPWFTDEGPGSQSSLIRNGLAASGSWYGATSGGGYQYPSAKRDLITFFSPDFTLTDYRITPDENIDYIINYGHYDNYYSNYTDDRPNPNQHTFASFYHNSTQGFLTNNLSTDYKNGPVIWVDSGEQAKLYKNGTSTAYEIYSKLIQKMWTQPAGSAVYSYNSIPKGYIFLTDTDVSPLNVGPRDYGAYHISYARNLTIDQQYGDSRFGVAIPTGAYYDLENDSTQFGSSVTPDQIDVFGGDVFTCKALLKARAGNTMPSPNGPDSTFGAGIEYYCQSFVNPQLRYNADDNVPPTNYVWPLDFSNPTSPQKFQEWFSFNANEEQSYNASYNDENTLNVRTVYDENIYYDNLQPATIYYSEPKLQESVTDSYAYIKPTNRKDLDITLGPINHHEVFNGELVTFQEKSVQRQFFNTTAMFADATSQIVMGDGGAVLSRKGYTYSTYGIVNKWGVVKGRSQGGNDVLYWFDAINKKIFRLGQDGVVPISTRGNIDSFLANYTNFIQLHDTPANDQGVHGIWDESNNEAVFTFRARKQGINYDPIIGTGIGYNDGDVVYYTDNIATENYDWHRTGEFYESLDDANTADPSDISPIPAVWSHIPHNDNNYYNEFSIVYSEDKNGFTTFYTPKPKIYLSYKDNYLSPRPIDSESKVYEHNRGIQCVWYDDDVNPLQDVAYIEGVVNYNPEIVKTAEAVTIDAYTAPYLVEVRTQDHNTYMDAASFTLAETMYRSPVKNDTLGGTVTPDGDTSRPYGRWIALKYIMQYGYKQAIRTFVMKIRPRNRMYNR